MNENDKQNNKKGVPKKEYRIWKYSELGRGILHEAIIIGDVPYFIRFVWDKDYKKKIVDKVEKVEETARILRPPRKEEYPYSPYVFEDKDELEEFIRNAKNITLDELFQKIKNIFKKYVDQEDYIITLLSADSIWTYFQDIFSTTHYLEGVGDNNVGKTSIAYVFEYTGYRVVRGISISGANYYRILECIEPGQCVIIEDEGDNISDDADKQKILKSGYEYNGKVPKTNMNSINQELKWFFTYGYKMILAEKSLNQLKAKGLVDRILSFHCRPGQVPFSIKEVVSENINKNPNLQELYDEIRDFRMLMLCYRLLHYTDTMPEIETGLKNRENELCKPLLQLFAKTDVLKEIVSSLQIFLDKRREKKLNSIESTIYPIIKKFVSSNTEKNRSDANKIEQQPKLINPKLVSIPFSDIWSNIIDGGIDGYYDENKKNRYETVNFGIIYRNKLSSIIADKFGAKIIKKVKGSIILFDLEELERFEQVYGENIVDEKINIKIVEEFDEYFIGLNKQVDDKNYDGGSESIDGYTEAVKITNSNHLNNEIDDISIEHQNLVSKNNTNTHILEPSLPSLPSTSNFKCYYCHTEYTDKGKYTKHCLNTHPKKPIYPDLSFILQMNLEPKGNSWEK